ncbi:MAG: glycosyltransferase family 2 protein, partial [Clostridia bacterium]
MPVYNAQKTLARCLDSVLSQSYSALEVLAIDDGSTDNSWDVVQELC